MNSGLVDTSACAASPPWRYLERVSRGHLTRVGLRLAAARVVPVALVVVLAYAVVAVETTNIVAGVFGFDFRGTLWEPARAIAHGASPYPPVSEAALLTGNPALYPPLVPVLLVPLGLLPFEVVGVVWAVVLASSVVLALRYLGVSDLRCYGIALLTPLVADGIVFGNLTILVFVAACLAWSWRDRPLAVGVAIGFAIAAKLVAWPLLVWLLVTRRYRAARWSVILAAVGLFGPWLAIGFRGLADYPALLRAAEDVFGPHGFSLAATAAAMSHPEVGVVLCLLVAAAALAVGATRGRDLDMFAWSTLAVALASPIAWPYTFSVLLAAVAAASPSFSLAWVLFPTSFLAAAAVPHPTTPVDACCRPLGTPDAVWEFLHVPASTWRPVAFVAAAVTTVVVATATRRRTA